MGGGPLLLPAPCWVLCNTKRHNGLNKNPWERTKGVSITKSAALCKRKPANITFLRVGSLQLGWQSASRRQQGGLGRLPTLTLTTPALSLAGLTSSRKHTLDDNHTA